MTFLDKYNIEPFNYPSSVKRLVFCDFDETYLPFSNENKNKSGVSDLENLIQLNHDILSLLIGWVTGSNLESVLRKSDGYISYLPHFIASSLGTEFHWIKNGQVQESEEWANRIVQSGFSKKNIDKILVTLSSSGINLIKQNSDYQGKYKESYYYSISETENDDIKIIKEISNRYNVKASFTRCNPAAGDPENSYDVDFIPTCCGKDEVVLFLCEYFSIDKSNTWSFGDSFNDFPMFKQTDKAFLVGNADPDAKAKHKHILQSNYCFGIKEKLSELLG
ncbi:HAD-IIB family hydrolase [Zooshikella ganghwensis]|uniref:HAD-IIB family hydrolase n=1 Tax=Zooshikella ganghwensis TaxID=202772 RepID=A0A4P9VGL3_9GAMM|nr:HAD-IIB family hydrolase [Zooshikella ganghwensis]RDH41489.1 HAD-IIB family hydrolase [Zooshikella ganghwensis]